MRIEKYFPLRTVNDGEKVVQPTEYYDVDRAEVVRIVTSTRGNIAAAVGWLTVTLLGKIGSIDVDIKVADHMFGVDGLGPQNHVETLFDCRGFDKVKVAFSYSGKPLGIITVEGYIAQHIVQY